MDAVLQIFKRSICPGTPFFESLAKKPPTTMDDLFRRANKYSMLENDVRATTRSFGCGRASRGDPDRYAKPPDRPKQVDRRREGPSPGHLKQYLRSDTRGRDASQHHNSEPLRPQPPQGGHKLHQRGPSDKEYDSGGKEKFSSADLVQASVVAHMGHSLAGLENPDKSYSDSTGHQPHPWETSYRRSKLVGHSQRTILGRARAITLQCHFGPHMASLHESHPFYISSNGEFPHQRGAD
ncbi:hypothetical protein AAG906_011157 [Vitis piasezkii]